MKKTTTGKGKNIRRSLIFNKGRYDYPTFSSNISRTKCDTNLRFAANWRTKKAILIDFWPKHPILEPFWSQKITLNIEHFFLHFKHFAVNFTWLGVPNVMQTLYDYVAE